MGSFLRSQGRKVQNKTFLRFIYDFKSRLYRHSDLHLATTASPERHKPPPRWLARNRCSIEHPNNHVARPLPSRCGAVNKMRKNPVSTHQALSQATEFSLICNKAKIRGNKTPIKVKWEPPDPNTFKLNIDASVKNSPGPGGLGGLVRNHLGYWIIGFFEHTPLTNPIRAKLLAIRRGLQIVVDHNLTPIEINTDSAKAIHRIKDNNLLYDNLIVECRYLMSKLEVTKLSHVFREQNRVADALAKEGTKVEVFDEPTILIVPPLFVQKEVEADTLGTMYIRLTNNIFNSFQDRDVTQSNENGHLTMVDAPIHCPS
ncbi:hypothetical protein KY289_027492 [Solanum tuberosum]|nr:hypothetical protein KY289_027492 [Solanum tuberosum]